MSLPKRPPDWLIEKLVSDLAYDQITGMVSWVKPPAPRFVVGARAGGIVKTRGTGRTAYRFISFRSPDGRRIVVREHNIAWLHLTGAWPKSEIDHRDGDGLNNKWDNIREASSSQQRMNSATPENNKSGAKGVSWHRQCKKWEANITLHQKRIHLGVFEKFEDAVEARRSAEYVYFDVAFIREASDLDAVAH